MGCNYQNYKIDFKFHIKKWQVKNNFLVISLNKIENKIINNRRLWKEKLKVHEENKNTGTKYDSLKLPEHIGQKQCSHQSWTE